MRSNKVLERERERKKKRRCPWNCHFNQNELVFDEKKYIANKQTRETSWTKRIKRKRRMKEEKKREKKKKRKCVDR